MTLRAAVAQLDRVLDYESSGQRFESSRVHHLFSFMPKTPIKLDAYGKANFNHGFVCEPSSTLDSFPSNLC